MPATHRLPASKREHDRLADEIDRVLDARETRIFAPPVTSVARPIRLAT